MKLQSIPASRQKDILGYIEKHETVTVKELSEHFNMSEATIRRDLDDMAVSGLIERTHGGAMRIDKSTVFEMIHSKKMEYMIEEKKRIGKKAADFIRNGDTIFLDAGTTVYFLAMELWAYQNLTVVTNDLNIASSILLDDTSQLIVTGGVRRNDFGVLIGNLADDFLRNINIDRAFMGADAIDISSGITNTNLAEANIKRIVLQNSNFHVLLADHTKLDRKMLVRVADLSTFNVVIMDAEISQKDKQKISEKTELILV